MVPGKDGLVLGRILPFTIPHPQPVLGDEALQTQTLFLLQGLSSSTAVEQAYIGGLQAQDRDRHQLGLGVVALEIQHELLHQRAPQEQVHGYLDVFDQIKVLKYTERYSMKETDTLTNENTSCPRLYSSYDPDAKGGPSTRATLWGSPAQVPVPAL